MFFIAGFATNSLNQVADLISKFILAYNVYFQFIRPSINFLFIAFGSLSTHVTYDGIPITLHV